ncbi:MAG: WD40 repeat domain-containing protein [Thiogranum sp.]|nr:WD40 repeat domain-containing protein [Thiogranum sp.]
MNLSNLFKTAALGMTLVSATATATEADIYSIQFSEDGKYLVTGGSGGFTLAENEKHTGGIKIWNSETGALVEALGQRSDLDEIFGTDYGRVGDRRWGISNFKDVVLTGSYPNGKILLLPSSLGHMVNNEKVQMPDFIGGYLDFAGNHAARIELDQLTSKKGNCDPKTGFHDYVGPVVPSDNGKYAAIVVNTCKATPGKDDQQLSFEYTSDLHVMDLAAFRIIKSVKQIDAGVYALGIADSGNRVAFVGRDQFAVIDVDSGKRRVVETYKDSEFIIPRQFSSLEFSKDGNKLISLRNIYDIETGIEKNLKWAENDAKKPRRISSVKVAPDLSYFAIVVPKRSLITFGDDGLPQSYGKADKVMLLNTETGARTELEITKSMTEGKRCVTDISPDSLRVAVGCKGGLLRVYEARTGKLIWDKQNIGQKHDNGLMQVQYGAIDQVLALLDSGSTYR